MRQATMYPQHNSKMMIKSNFKNKTDLFLVVWGVSIVVALVYIPTNSVWRFFFPKSSPAFVFGFSGCQSDWGEMLLPRHHHDNSTLQRSITGSSLGLQDHTAQRITRVQCRCHIWLCPLPALLETAFPCSFGEIPSPTSCTGFVNLIPLLAQDLRVWLNQAKQPPSSWLQVWLSPTFSNFVIFSVAGKWWPSHHCEGKPPDTGGSGRRRRTGCMLKPFSAPWKCLIWSQRPPFAAYASYRGRLSSEVQSPGKHKASRYTPHRCAWGHTWLDRSLMRELRQRRRGEPPKSGGSGSASWQGQDLNASWRQMEWATCRGS
jgi:hypothetical protein